MEEEGNEQLQTNTNENSNEQEEVETSEFEVDDENLGEEEDWENQTEETTTEQKTDEVITNQQTEQTQQQPTKSSLPKLNIPITPTDYTEEEEVEFRNLLETDPFQAIKMMTDRAAARMIATTTQVSSATRRFAAQNPELSEYVPVIEQILPNLPDNIRNSGNAPEIAFLWSLGVQISQGGGFRDVLTKAADMLNKKNTASRTKSKVVPQPPNQRTPTSSATHNVRQTVANANTDKPTTTAGRNMQAIYPGLSPSQIEGILREDRERAARRRR